MLPSLLGCSDQNTWSGTQIFGAWMRPSLLFWHIYDHICIKCVYVPLSYPKLLFLDPSQKAVGNHPRLTKPGMTVGWTTALIMSKDFQDAAMTSLSFGVPRRRGAICYQSISSYRITDGGNDLLGGDSDRSVPCTFEFYPPLLLLPIITIG